MKNPYLFSLLTIALFVGAIFAGKSKWFKNLVSGVMPITPADGTACKMPDGSAGLYKNGVCIKTNVPPNGNPPSDRTGYINPMQPVQTPPRGQLECKEYNSKNECIRWGEPHSAGRTTTITAPPSFLLPFNAGCKDYNTSHPYHYQGCSYVFDSYVSLAGTRYCMLKRISCP